MDFIKWKLDNIHNNQSAKSFVQSVRNELHGGQQKHNTSQTWTLDIILYILFFIILIAFVYIVMTFARDFKS